ncbi:MAG: protein-disulfide reductase DsbD N-terminal domain-containing protein [Rudaea sp.]|uniref:protein-disulfide reductase DsbD domain-containing protein n=1 Tax=unclassified Rudaea TaxID=2627037 RepID=UPI0010F59358|nr:MULTISPECIES: protein-disulfide reductase DsbD domain-containing protein [unclassified Rudaea]MBN8885063.1 protein-disulfide reductase DsbD N-terminal domain-containing protein [Rudaea sp.]MBR0347126.1 protein-disulfide reductase DsbD N-terminal domain-containing protein [Rudaea sp.]
MYTYLVFFMVMIEALSMASQTQDAADLLPIDEAFRFSADAGAPGAVRLHWTIAPDYYLYRGQMKFKSGEGLTLGEAKMPDGKKYHDEYLGNVEIYHGDLDATVPYTLAPGAQRIRLSVRYQGCHETHPKICYPPHTEELNLALPDQNDRIK